MALSEEELDRLDEAFPALARQAVADAREAILRSGSSVVGGANGHLIEFFPDGTQRILGEIPPRVRVKRGLRPLK